MTEGGNPRSLLRIAILLLCVGAAVLLMVILSSNRLDNPGHVKAFETAIFVSFIALPVSAGAHLIARQPGIALFGYLTILVAIVALLLSADLIWKVGLSIEGGPETLMRWVLYTLLGTLASGIASMLLAGHEDTDADIVKLVRGMTVFALFGLFVAVIAELRVRGQDVDPHLLGALSVFFVLGMLILPLLQILGLEDNSSSLPTDVKADQLRDPRQRR
jgi:hypothetical protein